MRGFFSTPRRGGPTHRQTAMSSSHTPSLLALCLCPDCPACLTLGASEPLDAARPVPVHPCDESHTGFPSGSPGGSPAVYLAGSPVGQYLAEARVHDLVRHAGFADTPEVFVIDDGATPLSRRLAERSRPLRVGSLLHEPADGAVLRLSAIGRMNGVTAADRCRACVAGLFSLPGTAERSRRHGLTLLWLDASRVYAALVFRGALHALADLSFPALFGPGREDAYVETFIRLLDDFRLGWLPAEEAARHGGIVWRAETLPDEAEGFKPLVAAGPEAGTLAGRARIMAGDPGGILCRGLLYCAREAAGQTDGRADAPPTTG